MQSLKKKITKTSIREAGASFFTFHAYLSTYGWNVDCVWATSSSIRNIERRNRSCVLVETKQFI